MHNFKNIIAELGMQYFVSLHYKILQAVDLHR